MPDQVPTTLVEERISQIKVPRLTAVTPWLWRGAQPSKDTLLELGQAGIRTVINLRWSADSLWNERQWILETDMNYIVIPLTYIALPTRAQVHQFLSVLDDRKNHPIFVHCQHGVDRTGMMLAIWRIARDNWSADEAYDEMRAAGFHKFPMYHFKFAVYNFADKWERWKRRGVALTAPNLDID
ncbi:MAG TPA: dual specificity protein phosphatase family protein [Oculatellaceae cyanobacterium]